MRLILILLLTSCGLDVNVDTKPVEVIHKIGPNLDAINEFCESNHSTSAEVEDCVADLTESFNNGFGVTNGTP